MDLNYLHSRHQISLINANNAGCVEARRAHMQLATLYAARINAQRARLPRGSAAKI